MRLLVNAMSARRGGITTYTRNLIDALEARGIETTVAVPHELHQERPCSTVSVRASEFRPIKRVIWEQTVWRNHVRRYRPDILFSSANFGLFWSPVPQVLLLREGGLFDTSYLTNRAPSQGVHAAAMRTMRRSLMLMSARHADQIVVPSEAMRASLLSWAPSLASKCQVNLYGTLSDLYRPEAAARPWRDDGVLRLLYVSVYYPHKNPGLLCQAVRLLNAQGFPTHATITMDLEDARRSPGGALDYRQMERALRSGEVTLGARSYDSLPSLYRSHDVFIFPSVSETFGHPMAEALSSGLPIIAADTPVTREVCGSAALYFKPFSASSLCERLAELDRSPSLREELARRSRDRALGQFKWADHVDRLIEIFESVIRKVRRPARTQTAMTGSAK